MGDCSLCNVFSELLCLTPCSTYINFTKPDQNDIMKRCAASNGLDFGALQDCANGPAGKALLESSARESLKQRAAYGTKVFIDVALW